jgi:hypothetical protein
MSSVDSSSEVPSYEPFVRAANYALHKLSKLKLAGIIAHDNDDDESDIIFHHNDMPVKQKHQGVESMRKPDVVVVSYGSARGVLKEKMNPTKSKVFDDIACKKPAGRFQWADIRLTFEFKCASNHNMKYPDYDQLDVSDAPAPRYMEYGKGNGNASQPTSATPAVVPTQSGSNPRKPFSTSLYFSLTDIRDSARQSVTTRSGKRPSGHLGSDEPSSK